MLQDEQGNLWYKGNLHMHTTRSDGRKSPEESIQLYRENGYDFLALTDHWFVSTNEEKDGILLISGCEYDFGKNVREGIYHLVGLGMESDPHITREDSAQSCIDKIHAAGGIVNLAHTAWSLNTPEQIFALHGVDATEIYNSVSGLPHSNRPDSGLIIDMIAARGLHLPLLAADDTHFYKSDVDACRSYILVQAETCTKEAILSAILAGKFYATQGPTLRVWREERMLHVQCSPAQSIVCCTDTAWEPHRADVGTALTEAHFQISPAVGFARIEVTDEAGNTAWSQIIDFRA